MFVRLSSGLGCPAFKHTRALYHSSKVPAAIRSPSPHSSPSQTGKGGEEEEGKRNYAWRGRRSTCLPSKQTAPAHRAKVGFPARLHRHICGSVSQPHSRLGSMRADACVTATVRLWGPSPLLIPAAAAACTCYRREGPPSSAPLQCAHGGPLP